MGKSAVLELSLCFNAPGGNFCQLKILIRVVFSIAENLKSKVKVTRCPTLGKNEVLEPYEEFQGGF